MTDMNDLITSKNDEFGLLRVEYRQHPEIRVHPDFALKTFRNIPIKLYSMVATYGT